jgi:hypothetical protein
MASAVTGPNSDGLFLLEQLKEHDYAVPPWSIEDLGARVRAALIPFDANMLSGVPENALRRTVVCLEMDGNRLEHLL